MKSSPTSSFLILNWNDLLDLMEFFSSLWCFKSCRNLIQILTKSRIKCQAYQHSIMKNKTHCFVSGENLKPFLTNRSLANFMQFSSNTGRKHKVASNNLLWSFFFFLSYIFAKKSAFDLYFHADPEASERRRNTK